MNPRASRVRDRVGARVLGPVAAGLMVAVATVAFLLASGPAARANKPADATPVAPVLNDGEKWRIGYLEGGQYPDYEIITKQIVAGLINLGWMEPLALPEENDPEPGGFWRYLAENAKSDYIEFVSDAYYAPGHFDSERRAGVRQALIDRIREKDDLDLILALGTWAGQDLATPEIDVPVIVASSSDPVASGIVASAEDSGLDHLHAKVEPGRYERQVELFYEITPFDRLGIVYEDSLEGRTFGGVDAAEAVAERLGFEIVACHAPFKDVTADEAKAAAEACYEDLAPQVDAMYVTVHGGVTNSSLPRIVGAFIEAQIPSFSMLGSNEVRRGVLMSISQANFSYVGAYHARIIAQIFNGAQPRDLTQIWEAPAKIALNLETAALIGFDPPVDIMLAADEIYETIEGGPIPGVN